MPEVRSWVIMRCPMCALVYSPPEAGTVSRCYCGTQRELERVEVVPRSELDELHRELGLVKSLGAEVERLRGLLKEALDIADSLHWPEGPLAEDGIGFDLHRIRREGGLTDLAGATLATGNAKSANVRHSEPYSSPGTGANTPSAESSSADA